MMPLPLYFSSSCGVIHPVLRLRKCKIRVAKLQISSLAIKWPVVTRLGFGLFMPRKKWHFILSGCQLHILTQDLYIYCRNRTTTGYRSVQLGTGPQHVGYRSVQARNWTPTEYRSFQARNWTTTGYRSVQARNWTTTCRI